MWSYLDLRFTAYFGVLKETEICQYTEYQTKRLVLEAMKESN